MTISARAAIVLAVAGLIWLLAMAVGGESIADAPRSPSVVLLTLDTTRADHLGSYGSKTAATPTLDRLAERGTRFSTAISASPLTLPAHASLLTGLLPPEHGVRENGTARLDETIPTLATVLAANGYETGAFVSSRVLDRRFGLASGFETYDDSMTAENLGQYGYPERDAEAVTSAAIEWLSGLSPAEPYLLWVHYYDPHLPYAPPEAWRRGSASGDYEGEIAFMDQQIGRLLESLPKGSPRPIIAVAGDHGEMLGEHGEESHGIFLYRASLEVPLLISGPGVPAGHVVDDVVASRRLAATVMRLLGNEAESKALGSGLPGLDETGGERQAEPVFSESRMPASAYGWSPITALTDQRWRFIDAPRPELYDFQVDPGEAQNLIERESVRAGEMKRILDEITAVDSRSGEEAAIDPQLAADLRALGYLSDAAAEAGDIDPKDGIDMLAQWGQAKQLMRQGNAPAAAVAMRTLVEKNPANIPFLTHLARAELASGNTEAGLSAYRKALDLNPNLDFLHLSLAGALVQLGRPNEARPEFERALELNPRSADAWLALAELAQRAGRHEEERRLLMQAVENGTGSAGIRARLGQIEAAAGNPSAADAHFRKATELAPEWPLVWVLMGRNAEVRERWSEALEAYRRATEIGGPEPGLMLHLGRLELEKGDPEAGRRYLLQVVASTPNSSEARQARQLLDQP